MSQELQQPASDPLVGIDLGTTYSLVCVVENGAPTLIPNPMGERLTPSAVAVKGGIVLVGAPARARAAIDPENTALAFKRDMGTDRRFSLGGHTFSAAELSAQVLASLRRDAEAYLGRPVARAIVTVPAYFNDLQRRATRDAGRIAGLEVERLVNEPTAAAIAYGMHQRDRELKIAVLDLGGGTFDVTVLEIMEGVLEVQSTAGDTRLGGDDFTRSLVDWAAERIGGGGRSIAASLLDRARLFEACEIAKARLTASDEASIVAPQLRIADHAFEDVELTIQRDEADELWGPLLDRLRAPIFRSLRDAGIAPEAIDEVLLVGGASRMPCVAKEAAKIFGKMPLRHLAAGEVVAHGAALQAALHGGSEAVEDLVVTDVAPFSLGVATGDRIAGRVVTGLFSPVLERGTVIPASRVRRLFTMEPRQRRIRVEVYQGEHALCRDNRYLGHLTVAGIPPGQASEHSVDIRFTYDLSGVLEVEVTVTTTGVRHVLVLEDSPGKLTEAQIEAARRAMASLKFHPRDALPNVTALERGEALFVELTGPARLELSESLAGFRVALDSQEPSWIDSARRELVTLIERLR